MNKNNKKQKILVLEPEFANELEVLCELVQTNFATKAKELLFQWQIDELKNIKEKSPSKYNLYLEKIKKSID